MSARTVAVHGATIHGVEALPVTVEVAMGGGIPTIRIVGMPDASVLEARGRIRCALRNAGFELPRRAITVNLRPADLRKSGSALDLPITVAILAASGQIAVDALPGMLFVGELGLEGEVLPVKGEVAYQILSRERGLILVGGWGEPLGCIDGVRTGHLAHIARLRDVLPPSPRAPRSVSAKRVVAVDYEDVVGQEVAKRALAIAATGGHGAIMIGPPGSGKTMLAERLPTILPPIEGALRQEALCIHSVAGESLEGLLAGVRPFRAPHHSITPVGLVGGGRPVRPGEVSLAHGGCLYLDEVGEFGPATLQMLRQPLESGFISIIRNAGAYRFPARFQLVAASNPCPCGYLGDPEVSCSCTSAQVARYRSRLAGPLMDRIDMALDVARPDPSQVIEGESGLSSADLAALVTRGRAFRDWRLRRNASEPRERTGALGAISLAGAARDALERIARTEHLTARGISRLAGIARTIADIDESPEVERPHVLEAALLRGRGDAV